MKDSLINSWNDHRVWRVMTNPSKQALKKYYTLLFSGKISKAEKALERMRKRYKLSENDGYYKALYGIYYSYVSDDRNSYVFKVWERFLSGESKRSIERSFKELLKDLYDPPSDFIQAWIDFIRMLDKLPTPHKFKRT